MVGGAVYKKVTARIVARPIVSRDCVSGSQSGGRRGALRRTGLRKNRGDDKSSASYGADENKTLHPVERRQVADVQHIPLRSVAPAHHVNYPHNII